MNNITPDAVENESRKPQTAKKNNTFDAKNYLNTRLDDNQDEKELKIRLLTVDKDSNSPFKHIFMHNVKVPKEIAVKGYKSYVCLEKTEGAFSEKLGKKCPFCEMNRKAWKKSKEATTEAEKKLYQDISVANIPSEVSIIRCIERGHEEDGPKFWKFNLRQDKSDAEHLMKDIYFNRKSESIEVATEENNGTLPADFVPDNIFDLENGKDLKLKISAVYDKQGKRTSKTSLKISDVGKNKPLSDSEEQIEEWINDEKVWSDVFVAKPYEYLELILKGEQPWFDRESGKWVSRKSVEEEKEQDNKEKEQENKEADENIKQAEMEAVKVDTDNNEVNLPF